MNNRNATNGLRFDSSDDGEPPEVGRRNSDAAVSVSNEADGRWRNNHNRSNNRNRDNNNRAEEQFGRDRRDRNSIMNINDQFETSKLVLQLVTDSSFNMTQINGQRKLGGPPPGWKGPPPGPGCEIFVGKIPRTLYEHEIYPIFRKMGEVYEIRLMMDFSGTNRGYCFVMFGRPEFAQRAIRELNDYEIRPGRRIGVVASINNCRLYVGQLPHDIYSETVIKKIYEITDDVGQVSVYRNTNGQARYALISYKTHRGAAMARRRLVPERASLFDGAEVSIDWAHPGMFPSNVVEESGFTNEHGNIEMSRMMVGNENRRYQTRRKARDEFLDSSIKSYIESDRALENNLGRSAPRGRQNASQQRALGRSLNGGCSVGASAPFESSKSSSSSSATSARSSFDSVFPGLPKPGIKSGIIITAAAEAQRKSSSSSVDLMINHRGSFSSESSVSSGQSDLGIVNAAMNNLFYGYPDRFADSDNTENQSNESGENNKVSNTFNLFESYTFAAVQSTKNDAAAAAALPDTSTGSSNDSARNNYCGNFSPATDDSEHEEDNGFMINQLRGRENHDLAIADHLENIFAKNKSVEAFSRAEGGASTKERGAGGSSSRSSSSVCLKPRKITAQSVDEFRGRETGPQNAPENVENRSSRNDQNRRDVFNRGWQLGNSNFGNDSSFENALRYLPPLQNRNENLSPDSNKNNNENPKTEMTVQNPRNRIQRNGSNNAPNFLNANANARGAWRLSLTQNGLQDRDFSSSEYFAGSQQDPHRISRDLFSPGSLVPAPQYQSQYLPPNDHFSSIDASGIGTGQQNSIQVARSRQDVRNRRYSSGRNGQRTGRPILSRSYANFCNGN